MKRLIRFLLWLRCAMFGHRYSAKGRHYLPPTFQPTVGRMLGNGWQRNAVCLRCGRKTMQWVDEADVPKATRARRLHNATSAALESDVERLYFWHGVMACRQRSNRLLGGCSGTAGSATLCACGAAGKQCNG